MKITNSYHKLGEAFYKEQIPYNVKNPELILFNKKLAKELNLDLNKDNNYLADIFAGNKLLQNSKPISLAYAGHQFGHFVPQLGDGRSVLLGEIMNKNNSLFDIHLKGSGRTYFSRGGDGKCPLDAAIREYVISEAMHFLKIPTTRSLAIVKSDEFIQREEFVPASIITRVAKSHIRIGTFEYFAAKGDIKNLKILADYAIDRHFSKYKSHNNKYLYLLKSVIKLQAELIASWMSIGFIHGVMNTDNTTISGQTIDYGPCAFMDKYDSNKSFSFIDKMGRYSFSNQKNIILWNLNKFAGTILPLINSNIKEAIRKAEKELYKFPSLFDKIYYKKMAKKIGIFDFKNTPEDKNLIDDFLKILEKDNIDFTNGFRILSKVLLNKLPFDTKDGQYFHWQERWKNRLEIQGFDLNKIAKKMDKINPILIPRNHIITDIIQKSVFKNDYTEFHEFLQAIKSPFNENKNYNRYYSPPKEGKKVINTFCGT
ncbi:YdiU family protein [Flavobacteriaceae bacterium]|nr:YdiU family protein [Flavobacteriaceae bacterium]